MENPTNQLVSNSAISNRFILIFDDIAEIDPTNLLRFNTVSVGSFESCIDKDDVSRVTIDFEIDQSYQIVHALNTMLKRRFNPFSIHLLNSDEGVIATYRFDNVILTRLSHSSLDYAVSTPNTITAFLAYQTAKLM